MGGIRILLPGKDIFSPSINYLSNNAQNQPVRYMVKRNHEVHSCHRQCHIHFGYWLLDILCIIDSDELVLTVSIETRVLLSTTPVQKKLYC